MSGLYEAVVAIKHGYEVNERTMYDDDMIGHAETLSDHHDEIIEALAKAAAFDSMTKAMEKNLGPEIINSFKQKVDECRAEIMACAPVAAAPKI
jgi:hypothetical protein